MYPQPDNLEWLEQRAHNPHRLRQALEDEQMAIIRYAKQVTPAATPKPFDIYIEARKETLEAQLGLVTDEFLTSETEFAH